MFFSSIGINITSEVDIANLRGGQDRKLCEFGMCITGTLLLLIRPSTSTELCLRLIRTSWFSHKMSFYQHEFIKCCNARILRVYVIGYVEYEKILS